MSQPADAMQLSNCRPRYLESVSPISFPEEAELPESQLHFELRALLYQLLSDHLGLGTTVGSDQFVYFDAGDPSRSVAPDVYVRLQPRGEKIRSWKTWERGAPEVAVEIVSESDASELVWRRKLAGYQSVGVRELVRFDPNASPSAQLRVWDRVDEMLQERVVIERSAPSSILPVYWVVAEADDHSSALRIADTKLQLIPTAAEARQAEAKARQAEAKARQAAEARVQELEAELHRRDRNS
ncbi:MAG TPA: Uma2 family endonuclease [Polyangiaceae bacterium]